MPSPFLWSHASTRASERIASSLAVVGATSSRSPLSVSQTSNKSSASKRSNGLHSPCEHNSLVDSFGYGSELTSEPAAGRLDFAGSCLRM